MIRLPPSPTLLPNTTLSRSEGCVPGSSDAVPHRRHLGCFPVTQNSEHLVRFEPALRIDRRHASGACRSHRLAIDLVGDVAGREDRKSTRLHSSHHVISYAVF